MRRVLILITVLIALLMLIGCAELVSEETKQVEVTITDAYHKGSWMQPVLAGKVTTFITHPAEYNIVVMHNNTSYTINDYDTYEKYKDCIGQTTTATLVTKTYDNGRVYIDITELK